FGEAPGFSHSRVWCASLRRTDFATPRTPSPLTPPPPPPTPAPLWRREAMANEGFKLSKGNPSHVKTGSFFKSRDDYRKHPILNGHLKRATPGLGIALGLFGVYLVVDGISSKFSAPKEHH
ncbi:hypothetical protein KC19_10G164800, partial [Ceratodon purpureus]